MHHLYDSSPPFAWLMQIVLLESKLPVYTSEMQFHQLYVS